MKGDTSRQGPPGDLLPYLAEFARSVDEAASLASARQISSLEDAIELGAIAPGSLRELDEDLAEIVRILVRPGLRAVRSLKEEHQ